MKYSGHIERYGKLRTHRQQQPIHATFGDDDFNIVIIKDKEHDLESSMIFEHLTSRRKIRIGATAIIEAIRKNRAAAQFFDGTDSIIGFNDEHSHVGAQLLKA